MTKAADKKIGIGAIKMDDGTNGAGTPFDNFTNDELIARSCKARDLYSRLEDALSCAILPPYELHVIPGVLIYLDPIAQEVIAANIKALIEQLEQVRSETLTAYLSAMFRFHRYSFGNVLSIAHHRPDATHIAGFHTWREL
jgi:hypothetical protein